MHITSFDYWYVESFSEAQESCCSTKKNPRVIKEVTYLIKKGSHFKSNFTWFPFTISNTIEGNCYFHENCFYVEESDDKYDINKLVGLSSYFFHHIESVRIGFRSNTQDASTMDLLLYAYDDGIRLREQLICSVKPLELFTYKIQILYDKFVVHVNDNVKEVERTPKNNIWFKYKLYPYYGGNQTAKQNMNITLSIK
jgi:hypothetical protein